MDKVFMLGMRYCESQLRVYIKWAHEVPDHRSIQKAYLVIGVDIGIPKFKILKSRDNDFEFSNNLKAINWVLNAIKAEKNISLPTVQKLENIHSKLKT